MNRRQSRGGSSSSSSSRRRRSKNGIAINKDGGGVEALVWQSEGEVVVAWMG